MNEVDVATMVLWAMQGELAERCRLCGERIPNMTRFGTGDCPNCKVGRYSIAAMLAKKGEVSVDLRGGIWTKLRDAQHDKA